MSAGFASSGSGGQGFAIKLEKDGDTKLGNSDGDLHQVTGTLQLNDNVFFLANGRLGLGTDAPAYKLGVAGNIGINEHVYHNGDGDTRVSFPSANQINLVAGGKSVFKFASNTITLNNGNNNIDTKIMADNGQEVIFVNAGNNRVGINTTSPSVDLDVDGSANISGQFARGVASVNLGSGTTSTLNPATSGAGTLLVTASSITTPTGGAANEGMHICSLADGTIAGQVLTIIIVSNFLTGAGGASDMGVLLITPNTPLNSSTGIVTFTGSAGGGNPQGSTAVLMWTGSAWSILSTRRGGGTA